MIFRLSWPETLGTRWGSHTDWIVRAGSEIEAREIAAKDQDALDLSEKAKPEDLTCEQIEPDGPAEVILWYGPDA